MCPPQAKPISLSLRLLNQGQRGKWPLGTEVAKLEKGSSASGGLDPHSERIFSLKNIIKDNQRQEIKDKALLTYLSSGKS